MTYLANLQIDWGKVAEILAASLSTLVAAYYGAKFAFDMQIRREDSKQVTKNVDNANIAMFTIRRFRDLFSSLLESINDPEIPFQDNYLLMKPFPSLNIEGPNFSYDALAFLLKSNEVILFKLASLQSQLLITLNVIRQRSEMHYAVVQPAIETLQQEHKLEDIPPNFPELVAKKLGPRLDATMENLTGQMLNGLKTGIEQCTTVANEMAQAVESALPKRVERRKWASRGSA